ncbi:MAG TPA: M48 family metalloprotease [Pyrinomonadaceae bacterium]|nr:M48 family metalloprotease [Pyrinomonadaceae bacterium]
MKKVLLASAAAFLTLSLGVHAQDCKPPAIVFNANADNLFSPEQEMFLGDAMMEQYEKDNRVISDEQVNAYLQAIGDRIAKHLPPTGIRFKFVVTDSNYTNAYTAAGGRIYVTRKMISFVRNEDELAGVIAHELGHGVVRHSAIDLTRYFRQILNISSVGDRADVINKYNQFLERYRTAKVKVSNNHEDNQQVEADRIGVYAAYAAGYDPNAFMEFWKRFTDAKKGSVLNDLFGGRTPADKRLKEMVTALKQIPPACLDKRSVTASQDFDRWRAYVINYSTTTNKESLNGLVYRRNLVPLRGDITHLRFSPDGKYLLAQDNSTLTILTREPFAVAFRVEMEDAYPAVFSRDSKTLIVYNKNLRVQKWDLASKDLVSTREVAIRDGFWQTRVSPDGKYLACFRYSADLIIYDIDTNVEVFREKEFYIPMSFEVSMWRLLMAILDWDEYPVFNMEFSPDGRYFLAGRKAYRPGGFVGKETIAIDLSTKKEMSIGEGIKKVLVSSMDFMENDKVIGQYSGDIKKSGIFAFPSGERIDQFELSGSSFTRAEEGDFITVRPVSGAAVGVYDLKAKKYILANKKSALDVYGNVFAAERKNGEVALYTMGTNQPIASVNLPASPLSGLRASAVSADGNWLAISDRSRGAAWNLQTGERVLHIRAFRGSHFTSDGKAYADFPKQDNVERSIALMDLKNASVTAVGNLTSEDNVRQHGQYLLIRKSNEEKKPDVEKDKGKDKKDREVTTDGGEEREKSVGYRGTTVEMRDVVDGKTLWTRKFVDETPEYFINQDEGVIGLHWRLSTKAAKAIIAADPRLTAKAAQMSEKVGDLLVEFVDAKTGKVTGHFFLETNEGSIRVEGLSSSGDYLMVGDSSNRMLVYSIASGELLYRFVGDHTAASSASKMIAIENLPGRVAIFDLATGRELERLSFAKPVTRMTFLEGGKRFFVLTSDQTAYMFDTSKFALIAAK